MKRSEIRERIFQLIFRIEFNSEEELREQIEWYFEDFPNIKEENRQYMTHKIDAILDSLKEIDEIILSICKGWRIERLGKTELAILRLAVYEIEKDEDIPTGVAINEAVELSKKYCNENAPRFVNGVLAKLV